MCGIVGGFAGNISKKIAEEMRDELTRRGPDGAGLFFDGKNEVFLGHRRLKIIDLSEAASQPMSRGNLVIVYNGEIYNFKEIREELEKLGYKFKSQSDTEVVLAAYEIWGEVCLNKFSGMFSFAIWDGQKREFFLARDRFGVKPFYYFLDNKNFLFASEIRALLRWPDFKKELDTVALEKYFQLGYLPAPFSIWKNIGKLKPGHWLKIGLNGEKKEGVYFDPAGCFSLSQRNIKESEALDELESILLKSFQRRLISDVDIGLFLSGGVDSSLLAALLAKRSGQPLKTFSIGFQNSDFNEAPFAKEAARFFECDHRELIFKNGNLAESLNDFSSAFDEPFADSSAIPSLLLSKFAGQSIKVGLAGDGADELFWGYTKYQALDFWAKVPVVLRRKIKMGIKLLGPIKAAKIYQKFPLFGRFSNLEEKLAKLSELEIDDSLNSKEDIQLAGIKEYLEGDILVKSDRAFMFYGVEAREPYLDKEVLEFFASLPDGLRYGGDGKYLLKKLLARYLPERLWRRPKSGFTPPVREWTRGGVLDKYLDKEKIKKQGVLDAGYWKKILDYRDKYSADKIWRLAAFQIWAEKWL